MTTLFALLALMCGMIGLWAEVRIRRLTEDRDRLDTVAFNRLAEIVRLQRDVACLNRELQQAREWNEAHALPNSKGGDS